MLLAGDVVHFSPEEMHCGQQEMSRGLGVQDLDFKTSSATDSGVSPEDHLPSQSLCVSV